MSAGKVEINVKSEAPSRSGVRQVLLAIACGVLVGLCGFLVDVFFHKADQLLASDLYTCLVAALFSWVCLRYEARRRLELSRRLEIAAEVNHHIRNALTGVVFHAAIQNDPELEAVLRDATARIDWVLNDVLPDGNAPLRWPVEAKRWKPAPWQGRNRHDPAAPDGAQEPAQEVDLARRLPLK